MEWGNDGLFCMQDGSIVQVDEIVVICIGMLEGLNVNVIDEMVNMFSLQCYYEL